MNLARASVRRQPAPDNGVIEPRAPGHAAVVFLAPQQVIDEGGEQRAPVRGQRAQPLEGAAYHEQHERVAAKLHHAAAVIVHIPMCLI